MAGNKRSGADLKVYCFVPSDEIDVVVLAQYLKSFIDGSATIKPSRHPRDKDRLGYTIGANSTLGREALEDLIQDSKEWDREQGSREFDERPYDYQDSDSWARRKRLGPTRPPQPRVIGDRRRERDPPVMPGRHDPRNAGTPSEIPSSYASTAPSSIFSRSSDETIAPSDSASQIYSTSYGRGDKPPPPKPSGPNQPHPVAFQQFGNLSLSDNNKPNQSAQRQQTTSRDRHAPLPKEDNKPNNRPGTKPTNTIRKDYDDTYH